MPFTYSWSTDEERYTGQHATREDAAIEAVCEAGLRPGCSVWVGENIPHTAEVMVRGCINADHVIEMLSEHAYDNVGEHAEDWPDVSKEDCKKLSDELVKAIVPLVGEPRFFSVTSSEPIEITLAMFLAAHPPDGLPHCRRCFEWIKDPEQRCEEDGRPCAAFTAKDLETP